MEYSIVVENIKCGGCGNTVTKTVKKVPEVSEVAVDVETGKVTYEASSDVSQQVQQLLEKAGYPTEGNGNIITTAKSYVSCAVGRMSKDENN